MKRQKEQQRKAKAEQKREDRRARRRAASAGEETDPTVDIKSVDEERSTDEDNPTEL